MTRRFTSHRNFLKYRQARNSVGHTQAVNHIQNLPQIDLPTMMNQQHGSQSFHPHGFPPQFMHQQTSWNQYPGEAYNPRNASYNGPVNGVECSSWGNPQFQQREGVPMQGAMMMGYQQYQQNEYYQLQPQSGQYMNPGGVQQQPVPYQNHVEQQQQQSYQTYQQYLGNQPPQIDQPPSYHTYANMSASGYYCDALPPPLRQPNFQSAIEDHHDDDKKKDDIPIRSQKTPQPKPLTQIYNGPPVSALVPRFPRRKRQVLPLMKSTVSPSAPSVGISSPGPHGNEKTEDRPIVSKVSSLHAPQLDAAKPKLEKAHKQPSSSIRQPLTDKAENCPETVPSNESKPTSDNSPKKPSSPKKEGEVFPSVVPIDFPRRLALPNDPVKLNALHCFLREKILEIFVVSASNKKLKFRHAPCSSVGRVGLRCGFCAAARGGNDDAPEDEAPMAVFYPKSLSEIYRLVTSWQRCHVRKCKNLPPSLRREWEELRHDKTRGKTVYWAESAAQLGMVDCKTLAGGIRFKVDPASGKCMRSVKDE